jgi:ornithine carbamoyltransferase
MNRPKKDLLSLMELSPEEIRSIIIRARELKRQRLSSDPQVLKNRTGVMIFEKPSLRTRITFETAINELGGHAINLSSDMIGMGRRESVEDIARNLERIVHLIIARTFSHQTIEELAKYSSVPVINALTDDFHPCQALAFGQTINERMGDFRQCNVVFIGDGNNVCKSIMMLCAKLGFNFTLVCPEKYLPSENFVNSCKDIGRATGSRFEFNQDIKSAVKNANFIYTDVWTSMGQEKEQEVRRSEFSPYQVNGLVMAMAPSDVCVSHCLPAHRGEEITSDVLDSRNSIAFDEAENRLHVQKSIIVHLFS